MKQKDAIPSNLQLSADCRKALAVHLGEAAGHEVAALIQRLVERIERLERGKVDITPVISSSTRAGGNRTARTRRTA